ncbi:MAG: isoleucine--tRNA ligase [Euryarchaeota archaeon RBG_16_62_10]|nr:MAG: isoleucine--tRNA ligase [Euryarchaeota archaeon RBG_16_62_10]
MLNKHYREPGGKTFPQLEEEILSAWKAQGILRKVKERMANGRPLVFCEGPPYANARPHMAHALTRTVKDAFLRYHIMNGRKIVPYIGGWDCHGLPVELEIERAHGLNGRKDIEAMGVGRFNELCRESVLRYKADWERMSQRIGYWLDFEHAYMTMSREYIESVWWSLKELHSKGLLARAHKVVPYCPRCGTTLSAHEVALGFRETEDRFLVVKFRLRDGSASLLAWTALPHSLVANAFLAVDREKEYVLFEHSGERLVVAADSKEQFAPGAKVLATLRGAELVGREYEPPFRYHDFGGRAHRVVHSTEVSKEEGTGILSVTPPYGSVDYEIGLAEKVGMFDPLDDEGRFTNAVPELEGKNAMGSGAEIMRMLEAKGLLFKWGLLRHSSPFCWRCDTALMYRDMDAWFVRTSEAKDLMVARNEEIEWVPEAFKHGRFGNFLADIKDWAISRTRYWGIPLPVWRCPRGHEACLGSLDELRALSRSPLPDDFDPHRPGIDDVVLGCPQCGGDMRREEVVIDCWYDSGCAPFAQYHYPFENIAEFDTHRSVDFIAEDVNQTRGWFYTQLALGALLFNKPAFMSVLVLGNVLDKEGRRFSQAAGNIVSAEEVFSSVGADATRLSFLSGPVWQNVQFSQEEARETMVGTLTTLLNVYAFFASNANAYGFKGRHEHSRTHDLDRWIVSRLHSTAKEARAGFDSLEVHRSVRAIGAFVGDLSGWYVRRSRRRFWVESDPQDRFSAHCTLSECLLDLSKLLAPIAPFFADWLYHSMDGPKESVHLEDYPVPADDLINATLEGQISLVETAVEAGRLARQKVNVKLRQPLPSVVIAVDSEKAWALRRFEKMIAEELNVKKVEVLESREKMIQYSVAPNLKSLGPKLKESAGEVGKLLAQVNENELVMHLRTKGRLRLGGFVLSEEDVIVSEKEKPGYSHASVGDIHVYVALEVTQNLKLEGLSREVIRRIQQMRKELGLEFEEPVEVDYRGHPDIELAMSSHKSHIMHETHARALTRKEPLEGARTWAINKLQVELLVRRL